MPTHDNGRPFERPQSDNKSQATRREVLAPQPVIDPGIQNLMRTVENNPDLNQYLKGDKPYQNLIDSKLKTILRNTNRDLKELERSRKDLYATQGTPHDEIKSNERNIEIIQEKLRSINNEIAIRNEIPDIQLAEICYRRKMNIKLL